MLSWVEYPAAAAATERVLLVMLPAAGMQAHEFLEQAFVADAQAGGHAIDIIAVQPDMSLYLDGGIAAALHDAVLQPALARSYRRIWLLGISLGGMGALLYAAAQQSLVEGVILLAPFLGTKGTIAALAKTGGMAGPVDCSITTVPEQRLLAWLREYVARGLGPAIYLGYGEDDRFAPGHRMLAELLPMDRVAAGPGGHDWDCWRGLWRQLLDRKPFES